jgi:hypothetical protein
VGPRTGLDDVEKRKFLTLPELELQPLCHPARSQSLYRLSFPGSHCGLYMINSVIFKFGMTVQLQFNRIWNRAVVIYFIVLSQNSSEINEEEHETFHMDKTSQIQDSKPTPPEY